MRHIRLGPLELNARLAYIIRYPSDLQCSVAFYCDTLGLQIEYQAEGYVAFRMEGPVVFALFARERVPELFGTEESSSPSRNRHEGELAFLTENVDALHAALLRKDVDFLCAPTDRPWGERTAYFKDPDGYLIEITQKL